MTGRQNGVYALPPRLTCERHWGRWRQNTRIRGIPWAPREHLLRRADLSYGEQQRSRKCIEKLRLRLIVRVVYCRQLQWFCDPPRRYRIGVKFTLMRKDATEIIDGMSYCNPNRFTEVPWLRHCGLLLRQVSLSLSFSLQRRAAANKGYVYCVTGKQAKQRRPCISFLFVQVVFSNADDGREACSIDKCTTSVSFKSLHAFLLTSL